MNAGIVAEIALEDPPRLPDAIERAALAYIVVRERGRPVGRLILETPMPASPEALHRLAREAAADGIEAARSESREAAPAGSDVAVVVATRNRPDDLDRCLGALRLASPPPEEIVVSDSASSDAASVAAVAARHGARLVRLDRPGLSLARNEGARAASRPLVAFLDDDCRADRGYVAAIARGFVDAKVAVVTGQLLPAEIDTPAQVLFLRYAHMDRRGFVPRRFEAGRKESRHWPLDAWRMGSGGNLAARRDAFERLGGFRTDLGLGTRALGGEDLYFLWSAVRSGDAVVYRPDAMAWHRHHRDLEALRGVLYGYGVGHGAFLAAASETGAPAWRVLDYRLSFWWDRAKRLLRSLAGGRFPPGLVVREMRGHLAGRVAR